MTGYLIYHPPRTITKFDSFTVYHDDISGNQDPYIWNKKFLHTYCHITQMSPQVGNIIFWVSGDTFPKFSYLYCDLVFVVAEKLYWENPNHISFDDNIVDSHEAYIDHYSWSSQHYFKRRRRYTLKADPDKSFQPQDAKDNLVDILPFLIEQQLTLEQVRQGLRAGFNSKPFSLKDNSQSLYSWLDKYATQKIYGFQLYNLRKNNPTYFSSSKRSTNKTSC